MNKYMCVYSGSEWDYFKKKSDMHFHLFNEKESILLGPYIAKQHLSVQQPASL